MVLKEQKEKFVYSDGEAREARLLEIARNHPEDTAEDFIAQNSQYLINNTFSSVRKNLLNWYPFRTNADILEIGAGAGALTGLLCDKGKSVVSLEMSRTRADIIRARYPDRKNLTIISESIQEWKSRQLFDYIVFVGVLEYASVFSDSPNPFTEFLQAACRHLKADGILLFAIENRFGLKYWLGASEDHLQKPFVGIEGYKDKKTARTFSKASLRRLCKDSQLEHTRFYSVFPDYKFPEIICAEGYTPSPENLRKVHFTYSRNSLLYADERDLYRELADNNVTDFFANSFLVESSRKKLPSVHPVFAAGKGEVKKEYRVSTVIYSNGDVLKIPVHEKAAQHIRSIVLNTATLKERGLKLLDAKESNGILHSSFHDGRSAQDYFGSLLEKNDFKAVCNFLSAYRSEIEKSSGASSNGSIVSELDGAEAGTDFGTILKDGYIDLTFYNAFYEGGAFIFYDQEWRFDNVPLLFILFYAVKSSYERAHVHTAITLRSLYEFLGITQAQQRIFERLEGHIWQKAMYRSGDFYGADGYCNRYDEKLTLKAHEDSFRAELANKDAHIAQLAETERALRERIQRLNEQIYDRDKLIARREEQIDSLEHSTSWRIMRPARFAGKCLRSVYRSIVPKKARALVWAFRHKGIEGAAKQLKEADFDPTAPEPITYRPVLLADEPFSEHPLPTFEKPLVSIIIPVYNQFGYTYNCIRSILSTTRGIPYEIIVGDDMSTDGTREIGRYFPGVRVSRNESDHGFLVNSKRAAGLAQGAYIVFLNNDTQVQEGWLSSLLQLMEQDGKAGMAGSKLVYPDGTLQEAGGIIWQDASGWNYGRGKNPELSEYNYVKEVDYISGASIMIRAALWKEIGGFDERYKPAYFEDSDLAFEVRKHGYKVVYQPASVAVHFEGASNGKDLSGGLKKHQVTNRDKFAAKWAAELKGQYAGDRDLFPARERNFGKKVILIIDHYVPTFDKDAGSKTTFQYIKMFLRKGYCVKFVGDNYARTEMEPYISVLLQMGVEVLYGQWYKNNIFAYIKENERFISFVYLNRPHIASKYIDFIKENTGIKILYYGHDLHFLRLQREYELTGEERLLKEAEDNKRTELDIMRKADVVYYPSCIEERAIKDMDPTIHVKAIHAYLFDPPKSEPYTPQKRSGILFVGGFSHSPNIDAVKWFAQEVFPKIRAGDSSITFFIAGSNAPEAIQSLDGNGIVFRGFVSEEELSKLYDKSRLVVVPLRYGAGVKGKVVEALYHGSPVVTTDIGAEGIAGLEKIAEVRNDAESFANTVLELYGNEEKLKGMSRKSLQFIKEQFSLEAAWDVIKDDFA